jgi:tRNA U34 5-methylaminomethyl-2-thiouridine-forming methyltransferase MnmC
MGSTFERRLIVTGDGSHSFELPGLSEQYHSTFGAIQESKHVFVDAGLLSLPPNSGRINILEIGFGTGLNALLTFRESLQMHMPITYHALEPFPLLEAEYSKLNFTRFIEGDGINEAFGLFHQCKWDEEMEVSPFFIFRKQKLRVQEAVFQEGFYDLIYFDAFGPDTQPEMWERPVFERMYKALCQSGLLTTYSSKGSFRRLLKECGFKVEKLAGPPGKREITRAQKLA